MGSVAAQLFSGLSRDVRSGSSPGHKDIQRLVLNTLVRCLGFVLRDIVLLEGEPLPQSEVLNRFFKDLSVLCSVHLSLDPD